MADPETGSRITSAAPTAARGSAVKPDPDIRHRYEERVAICVEAGVTEERAKAIALAQFTPIERAILAVAMRPDANGGNR